MSKLLTAMQARAKAENKELSADQITQILGIESMFDAYFEQRGKDDTEAYKTAMNKAISDVVGELPKGEDGKTSTIATQLRAMAEAQDKIASLSQRKFNDSEKYQLRSLLEKNKDEITKALNSSTPAEVKIQFRAASVMTTQNIITGVGGANFTSGTPFEFDNELTKIRYPENFILEIINSRQVNKVPANIIKRAQNSRQGNAEVVGEGETKPLISYDFVDKIWNRKKYAGHIEWTEELELDFEQLFIEIMNMFEVDILMDWHNGLLEDIITTMTVPYVSTRLDGNIKDPDIYSVIGAGVLSVQTALFTPDVIWMNPSDFWLMTLTQDNNGAYKLPPIMVGSDRIAGLKVYTSTVIDAGKMLIGTSRTIKEQHSDFIGRIGLINDQLITNEKTAVGEVFSIAWQADQEKASWVYLDIDAVMATLKKP